MGWFREENITTWTYEMIHTHTFPHDSQVSSFALRPLLRRSEGSLMEEEDGADCEAEKVEERVLLEDMRERVAEVKKQAGVELCIQCPGTASVRDQYG